MTTIFEDNQGTIALSNNDVHHRRTKHIDIRYHFIREVVAKKEVVLRYLPTNDMVADIFTKALHTPVFEKLRAKLMNLSCQLTT